MAASRARVAALVAAAAIGFAAVATLLLWWIPRPHRPIDYVAVGACATLVALGIIFVGFTLVLERIPEVFVKRRPAKEPEADSAAEPAPPET